MCTVRQSISDTEPIPTPVTLAIGTASGLNTDACKVLSTKPDASTDVKSATQSGKLRRICQLLAAVPLYGSQHQA